MTAYQVLLETRVRRPSRSLVPAAVPSLANISLARATALIVLPDGARAGTKETS